MNTNVCKPSVCGSAGGRSVPAATKKMKFAELQGKEITIVSYKLYDSIYAIGEKYAEIKAVMENVEIVFNTGYPSVLKQLKEVLGRKVVVRKGFFETLEGEKTKIEKEIEEREKERKLRKFYSLIPRRERELEQMYYRGELFAVDDGKTMIPTDWTKTESE